MTGEIHIDVFLTLDGVGQAPGAPDEDRAGGFPFGGWQAPYAGDETDGRIREGIERADALLLGRRTYDIFASYWPHHPDGLVGKRFDVIPKYVASRGTPALPWAGSTLLGPDLAAEIAGLRERHHEVHVFGGLDFARTLLDERLFDRLNLWIHPVVLGQGRRLFPEGTAPLRLTPAEAPIVSASGVVFQSFAPAGEPETGVMSD